MALLDTVWYLKDNGTVGYSGVTKWAASTSKSAGNIVRQNATPTVGNERCFISLTASGTTGGSEPSWNITRGATTTDNTITWMEATGQPSLNGDLTNTTSWAALYVASANAVLGQIVKGSAADYYYICTTAGNTGTSEPTWVKVAGSTTTDGSAVWTCLGAVGNFTTPFAAPHARIANMMQSNWMGFPGIGFVSNNHAETQASANTWPNMNSTPNKPVQIVCVSDTAAPPTTLATTASISTTGASADISTSNSPGLYCYGLNLNASNSSNEGSIFFNHNIQYWESCTFALNNTNTSSNFGDQYGYNVDPGQCIYTNCNFVFGSTSQNFNANSNVSSTFIGCNFAKTGSVPTSLFLGQGFTGRQNWAILKDCDLSAITGTIFDGSAYASIRGISADAPYLLENCKLGSGVVIWANGGDYQIYTYPVFKLSNSDSANTNYRYYLANPQGTIQSETTVVRTGGATDGTTSLSWNFSTNSGCSSVTPLISDEITQWNSLVGASHTATLYLTSNTSLKNNNIWVILEYLGDSSSSKGSIISTKASVVATPATLTSDSSTWGGSTTNKYAIAISFFPNKAGPVKATVYIGTPSLSGIYVDPKLVIT